MNEKLGIDSNGPRRLAQGTLDARVGQTSDGVFWVFEIWDSKAAQQAFMGSRLGAALGAVGVPAPRG